MSDFIDTVAAALGLSRNACEVIAHTASKRYKVFEIPKRNGRGVRVVAQPAREVKALQRTIVGLLEQRLPIHPAATAYKHGASIMRNATPHLRAKFITKLDFEGFFPSIDRASLGRHLKQHLVDLTEVEIAFILSSCMWKPKGAEVQRLCIGAPSSPLLSNFVMYPIDTDITRMCAEVGAVYTRYSDDICISAERPDVLGPLEGGIRARIAENRWPILKINEGKRVAVGRGHAMNVTGITLSNQGVATVGRQRKRGVRAGAMRYLSGLLTPDEIVRLKGEIAFVVSVERSFRNVLLRTYGEDIRPLLPRIPL